jgi:hypothetical protein
MSSNFIQNVQINNLGKKLNALATQVANLQVSGSDVIAGDIDMNNNSIVELNQLVFNSGHALVDDVGRLVFANNDVVVSNDLDSYQLKVANGNLDMNNNSILNVNGFQIVDNTESGAIKDFTLINGGLVSNNSADVRLYLYANESADYPSYLNFRTYPIENVGSVEFTGGATLTSTDNETLMFNNNEVATYTLSNDINGVNQYGIRQVSNVSITNGGGVLFGGVQNKLVPEADNESNLLYQNVALVSASNISDYLPDPVFVGTATSNLNMGNYSIINTNAMVSQSVGTNSLNFNNDPSKKLTVLGGDLQYQGSNVVLASDFNSYLPAPSFISTATTDLNMNNYNVNLADLGQFNAINFNANSDYCLNVVSDLLTFRGGPLATVSDIYDTSIIFNNIDCKQHSFTNLSGIGFGGGNDPQNLEAVQLTMSPDGNLLWNEYVVLNEANSNVQPAPTIYNVSDANSLLTNNITLNPNSFNYFTGLAVGSTFCVKFEALATNIGGDDPAWVPETQSTSIIYESSDTSFESFNFNATNAGVYFAIGLKPNTTDAILLKYENYNNK